MITDHRRVRPTRHRPIVVRTLADLSERNGLYAHCQHCRHARRLDVGALRERHGALSFNRLRRRLRCGRCGARQPELLHVWHDGG